MSREVKVKVPIARVKIMIAEGAEVIATTQLRKSSRRLLRVIFAITY